jgi:tetratricopeptide (TPR) repeat protein
VLCERIYHRKSPRDFTSYSERIGAVSENLVAISCFFERPWTEVTSDISENTGFLKGEAGRYLRALGRIDEACQPMKQAVRFAANLGDFENALLLSFNLAETFLIVGRIQSAIEAAKGAVLYANNSADKTWIVPTSCVLATAQHQRGYMNEAGMNFSKAWQACPSTKAGIPALFGAIGYWLSDFCLSSSERIAWFCLLKDQTGEESRKANQFLDDRSRGGVVSRNDLLQDLGEVEKREKQAVELLTKTDGWSLDIAQAYLSLARCSIYRKMLWAAPNSLEQTYSSLALSLENVRCANQTDYLATFLMVHAMVRYFGNDTEGARADLDEAWDIAERGPMRLHLADIHLYRARLFFRAKTYPWESPQNDLFAAEKLINDCGYHRRDAELADAKRVILRQ